MADMTGLSQESFFPKLHAPLIVDLRSLFVLVEVLEE
jgi:hypothetical protein